MDPHRAAPCDPFAQLLQGIPAEFIILNTQFLVFHSQFLGFDTQFLVLNAKFMIFARNGLPCAEVPEEHLKNRPKVRPKHGEMPSGKHPPNPKRGTYTVLVGVAPWIQKRVSGVSGCEKLEAGAAHLSELRGLVGAER